jgi:salicylate hydroxylase
VESFGKRLKNIEGDTDGKLKMTFEDGSAAKADAVIGSDGIKSKVRRIMFGEDHPCANPVFTQKYAYRGLVPMHKAIEAVGEERALNACMHVWRVPHGTEKC